MSDSYAVSSVQRVNLMWFVLPDQTVAAIAIASVMAVVVAAAATIKMYYGKKKRQRKRHSILPLEIGSKGKHLITGAGLSHLEEKSRLPKSQWFL